MDSEGSGQIRRQVRQVAQQRDDPGVGDEAAKVAAVAVLHGAVGGAAVGDGATGATAATGDSAEGVEDEEEGNDEGAEETEGEEAVRVLVDGRVVQAAHCRLCSTDRNCNSTVLLQR